MKVTAVRLFLTCWLIYSLHLATNTVREIYLALAIADHASFQVDEYAGLHPDLFETPGRGWHINSNPGASMLGAIPYALLRPVTDRIVARVNQQRASSGAEPPVYNSPWPMSREFFRRSWQRGYDIKFGIASLATQTLAMAPVSALGAVAMFFLLTRIVCQTEALWLALLYAFGTPIFFRTGYLNQNLLLAQATLFGLLALWPPERKFLSPPRLFLGGLAGGAAVLFDYSGVIPFAGLAAWLVWRSRSPRAAVTFAFGAAIPLALLLFYQWQCFGHPLYPAQHWMPAVQWVEQGYKGVSLPEAGMLFANLFDYRYGLLASCPLLVLAFWFPAWRKHRVEFAWLVGIAAALWLFASSVHYSKLQFNTGVRYLVPAVPLLFLPLAAMLVRLPRRLAWLTAVAMVAQAWAMAMYRDVERGFGVVEPLLHVFLGGFQLPLLTVLARVGGAFAEYFERGASPLPLFAVAGAVIYLIWTPRFDR